MTEIAESSEPTELITASEAAKLLSLSPHQVRRLARSGLIPVELRYGPTGFRRFRRDAVARGAQASARAGTKGGGSMTRQRWVYDGPTFEQSREEFRRRFAGSRLGGGV